MEGPFNALQTGGPSSVPQTGSPSNAQQSGGSTLLLLCSGPSLALRNSGLSHCYVDVRKGSPPSKSSHMPKIGGSSTVASSGSPTLVQQTERLDSSTPVLTTVNSSLMLLPDAHSPAAQGFAICPVSQTGGFSHPTRTGGPFSSSQIGGPSSDPLTAGPMMHSEREALLNDECPENLKEVLPPSEKYTYILEECKALWGSPDRVAIL